MSKKSGQSALPPLSPASRAEADRQADRLNRLVTTAWAADYLCVSQDTIRREAARGHLPVYRVSERNIRFKLKDVEALAKALAS